MTTPPSEVGGQPANRHAPLSSCDREKRKGRADECVCGDLGGEKDEQHKDDLPDSKRHLYVQVIKNNILVSFELTTITVARSGS